MHEPLKSCPFCGSKAVASINKSESLWSHDIVDWTQVHCTNDDCNAQSEPTCDGYEPSAIEVWNRRAQPTPPAVVEPPELSPDFTDTARAALLWVLWHHQGGSSPVGQPIRFALGMGQHDRLNEHQLAEAKRWERHRQVRASLGDLIDRVEALKKEEARLKGRIKTAKAKVEPAIDVRNRAL
jgi:hypothetical protein